MRILLKRKIRRSGSSYYIRVPKSFIDNGLLRPYSEYHLLITDEPKIIDVLKKIVEGVVPQ